MTSSLLFVHAHPDDETINNGVAMAHYAEQGHHVALVTCTAGEEGEVLISDLEHLAAAATDKLGEHRKIELANAMEALGVKDHRFLGGFAKYRDSGMMGQPSNDRKDCFWQADLLEASLHLVKIIRELKPRVLVTYDEFGGYGHPDHIQTHRIAMHAAQLAGLRGFKPELGDAWEIPKIYWNTTPRGEMANAMNKLREMGVQHEFLEMSPGDVPFLTDDELVTTKLVFPEQVSKKKAAIRAHGTQIDIEDGFFAAFELLGEEFYGTEHYRLVSGVLNIEAGQKYETDLLA
jgi:N-acetyl-1-D-myo-inositol-2-amino-2-deoxy-alpha-D-glucopyranoside deacetylase